MAELAACLVGNPCMKEQLSSSHNNAKKLCQFRMKNLKVIENTLKRTIEPFLVYMAIYVFSYVTTENISNIGSTVQ